MVHQSRAYTAEFSPDGKFVVTASSDKTARVWGRRDWPTGRRATAASAGGQEREVQPGMAETVLTASEDMTARFWDAGTGRPLGAPLRQQGVVGLASFSSDGELIATASDDHTARIWDVRVGRPRIAPMRHHGPVRRGGRGST